MSAEDPAADFRFDASTPDRPLRRLRGRGQVEFEVEFYARILDQDPYAVNVLRAQANLLVRAGQLAKALQLDRRLVKLQPDRPIPWYNLACSYAVLGLNEPAFFALQRALELGYRPLRHVLRDPDLKALRRDPRFSRLLRTALSEQL